MKNNAGTTSLKSSEEKFKYLVIIINEILAMQNPYKMLSDGMFASHSSEQQSQNSTLVTSLLISFPHTSFMQYVAFLFYSHISLLVLP